MNESVVIFDNVTMRYPMYHHISGGIKNFILKFPKSLIAFKKERFTALDNISFEIKKGEKVGIIGRNGAGKSTTLGLIAQTLKPSEGNVTLNGRVSPFLELGAGFHPELTGYENIQLNGILMGLRKAEVIKKINEIIEFSELGDFINQPIRVYSSGMLARLGFSVVAHLDPKILLIDEVLAVGDIAFQEKCIERMDSFQKSETTMIFVSHALDEVKRLCNKVIWIEDHKIKEIGKPVKIVDKYKKHIMG